MRKLIRDWEKLVRKGRLNEIDKDALREISGQMGERLELIFHVVETALGGPLQDRYSAQRAIAIQARARLGC